MTTQTAYQVLCSWGIQQSAEQLNWKYSHRYGQDGFEYPVYKQDENGQLVLGKKSARWKNADSKGQPKYAWIGDETDSSSRIYCLPKFSEATEQAKGQAFVVEGEKDLLTMMGAGFNNALTWLSGAKAIPENLIATLQTYRVTSIIHIPDLDKAGRDSATKLAALLQRHNIKYKALELPAELGEKGDVNDLWKLCSFDITRFREILSSLPLMDINPKAKESAMLNLVRPKTKSKKHTDEKELPSMFYQAVEQGLGVEGYSASGWSKPILCPFHNDQHPSASWHRDKHILKCFTCTPSNRDNYLAIQVGEKLNINWKDYTERSLPMNDSNYDDLTPPMSDEIDSEVPTNGKKPKVTDDEIGDYLIKAWDGNQASIYGSWHSYTEGIWTPQHQVDSEIWDALVIHKHKGVIPTSGRKNSVGDYLMSKLSVSSELADSGIAYCNLQNGLFNLRTGELEPHRRELYSTSQLSFLYNPNATCPTWENFLEQAFQGNQQLIKLLQEAIGYSLTADTHREAMFWLNGQAATGKSTALGVVAGLLGNAATTIDFNTLSKNQYQLANLAGKRVAIGSEIEVNLILSDALVKRMVSGESMVVRGIYRESVVIEPQAKLWLAMNDLPHIVDRSNGIYRRVLIIPFNNPISKTARDTRLSAKLKNELPGIFNWAIEGLKRLNEQDSFTQADAVDEAVADYQETNDIEQSFLNDEAWVALNTGSDSQADDLYIAHKLWRERFGYAPKNRKQLSSDWKRLGLETTRKSGGNFYKGIGLTPSTQGMLKSFKLKSGERP